MRKAGKLVALLTATSLMVASFAGTGLLSATAAEETSGFAQSFANPSTDQRMKVRTWWPSADISEEEIKEEVKQIADAGFGCIELIGITESFAARGEHGIDAEKDGWGSANWNKAVEILMREAEKYNIYVDLTIGPRWPAGIPNLDPNSDAAFRKLTYNAITETATMEEKTYQLPEAPTLSGDVITSQEFVGLVAAKVNRSSSKVNVQSGWGGTTYSVVNDSNIDESTLTVVDNKNIHLQDGTFTFTAPSEGEWVFYAYWAVGTGQTSGDTVPTAYVVNHFNKSGTQAIIDYWENNLLTDEMKEHYATYGGDLFEDSLELTAVDLPWCNEMAEYFQDNKGYNLIQYLPLLMGKLGTGSGITQVAETDIGEGDNRIPAGTTYTINNTATIDNAADQEAICNDFNENLSDMYIENHVKVIQEWCNSHNIKYRAQAQGTSDNNWVDSIEAASYLDVVEGETLGMNKSPDAFRSLAGAANMSGTEIVSVELGADFGALYQITWQHLIELVNRTASSGANQYVLHGFATRSQANSHTAWPGWMPFDEPRFSESWNSSQPSWDYMKQDFVDYVSRLQATLQYGKADVDFAVYRDDLGIRTDEGHTQGVLYLDENATPTDNPVANLGYSYNYISPGNFALDNAVVKDGELNPEYAGYQAIVINNEIKMNLENAQKILDYAKAGLSIVLIGTTPTQDDSFGVNDDTAVAAIFAELKTLDNVTSIADESSLPTALKSLGVEPSASFENSQKISVQHRYTQDADLYYLYNNSSSNDYGSNDLYHNDANTINTTVTLEGAGMPYAMNLWTGDITPIMEYTNNGDGTISMDISIMDNEAMVIGITDDPSYFGQKAQETATSKQGDGTIISTDHGVVYRTTNVGDYSVALGENSYTGKVEEIAGTQLLQTGWNLTVTSWEPGEKALLAKDDPNYDARDINKRELDSIALDELKPWNEIEGLQDISGQGFYTNTFIVDGNFDGAYLDLGESYDNILEVTLNGQVLPAIDQFNHILDLGSYLVPGENTLTIRTGTTLAAAVRKAGGNVGSTDTSKVYPTTYGLLGDISITPYVDVVLQDDTNSSETPSTPPNSSEETQTPSSPTPSEQTPTTGDAFPIALAVGAVLVAGTTVLVIKRKKF